MTDNKEKDTNSEANNDTRGTLKISSPGKLSLTKTVESGRVQQKFTHGRSKNVTVEVRKTRTFAAGAQGSMVEVKQPAGGNNARSMPGFTDEERQARLNALKSLNEAPKVTNRFAHQDLEDDEAPVDEEDVVKPTRAVAKDGVVMSPLLMKKQKAQEDAQIVQPVAEVVKKPVQKRDTLLADTGESVEESKGKLKLKARGPEKVVTGKLSLNTVMSGEDGGRVRSLASMRRQREKVMKKAMGFGAQQEAEKIVREVVIPEAMTVQELANRMAVRAVDVIKTLMKLGMMVTVTQSIDADTAELVVGEFGHKFRRVAESDVENVLKDEIQDDPSLLLPRPPVVTIMGHVDHGKTSLLDALRLTDVVAKEAGGITQHIGAYQVDVGQGKVTFLDTPGHEAFTAMRARGAKVTDIVVLVVAADDGIKAQTKEAIAHAKAANVPIIVAINKIDKPDADVARVKNDLMNNELVPEEFGGEVICVEVSAKQKLNLDKLVENILIQSEVLELKANPNRAADGAVIEAKLDAGRGVVATLLVQKGTLKVGDIVVAGAAYGRVRTLTNDKGQNIKEATPGMPVEIQGLNLAPEAGEMFSAVDNEKTARDIAEYREKRMREHQTKSLGTRSIEQMFAANKGMKQLAVIIKGDVQGSVEAIGGSISKFDNEEVEVKILHTGVGAVSESDVTLSKATGAMIIGFNVRATANAREVITRDKVNIRYYSVIYDVVNDIKAALGGMLSPTAKENFLGYAEIRQVFEMSKYGKVAGCYVTEGMIKRGAKVRLLRDNIVIHEGTLKTLKRFKDEVKEVKSGFECGMAFENYEDIREGDVIEAFEIENVARTID